MSLKKEDYVEPACVLCGKPGDEEPVQAIDIGRVMEKLRIYEDRNDWPQVERHLKYWLEEARAGRDERGQLTLNNELMGYYRKQGKRDLAFEHAEKAVELVKKLGMEDTITAGTTWVNAGTVREAFGDPEGGLRYFRKARENYEKNLPEGDGRLGGLYNNMALSLVSCGGYAEAMDLFRKALGVMAGQTYGELEQAITWLNMADAAEAAGGEDAEQEITGYLDRAEDLLNTESLPRNGYYAFVCEKCAPVFGHYGYFMTEQELKKRAEQINRRS
ncbi:MAG: tetratricopeptide repeat protein [Clostridia bacterium]|nr:tetratricopeptide repeat protein [Clostridia bacterium]